MLNIELFRLRLKGLRARLRIKGGPINYRLISLHFSTVL